MEKVSFVTNQLNRKSLSIMLNEPKISFVVSLSLFQKL